MNSKKARPPEVAHEQRVGARSAQNQERSATGDGEVGHEQGVVARPEQYQEGFETGYDQARDTPEELLGPNFARGIADETPGPPRQGRFSEGAETTGDAAEKTAERRFSEGIEGRLEDR